MHELKLGAFLFKMYLLPRTTVVHLQFVSALLLGGVICCPCCLPVVVLDSPFLTVADPFLFKNIFLSRR